MKPKFTRQKIADDIISTAIKFILSPENIQPLSWEYKSVLLDEYERIKIPRVIRKKYESNYIRVTPGRD
jgi:hypothetical protein